MFIAVVLTCLSPMVEHCVMGTYKEYFVTGESCAEWGNNALGGQTPNGIILYYGCFSTDEFGEPL